VIKQEIDAPKQKTKRKATKVKVPKPDWPAWNSSDLPYTLLNTLAGTAPIPKRDQVKEIVVKSKSKR
jgi:hypothetical protein